MGATADGTKELIAVADGFRESELSWKEMLLNLKARGPHYDPLLAIGDGALGFWKALEQVFPTTRVQRCTVHKTANGLDKMPMSVQPLAKRMLHSIWDAPKKEEALRAFELFLNTFEAKHSAAVECLRRDRDVLLTSMTFLQRTGVTSEQRIRSKVPLPRSVFVIERQRTTAVPKPHW